MPFDNIFHGAPTVPVPSGAPALGADVVNNNLYIGTGSAWNVVGGVGEVTAPVALTSNIIPKATGATTVANSSVTDDGTSLVTTDTNIRVPASGVYQLSTDVGISRLGAASAALGNGTAADFTGNLKLTTVTFADATTQTTAPVIAPVALTNNIIPKGTGAATVANSSITDNGTTVSSTEPFSSPGAGASSERYGAGSTSAGASGVAIGNTASASATNATAIGQGAIASAADTIALGFNSTAAGISSVVIGSGATSSTFTGATIVGKTASVTANNSVSIGASASATGAAAVAVGNSSVAIANATAVGNSATTSGASGFPVAIGANASATAASSVAISAATVAHTACAIGRGSTTTANGQFVMGSTNFPTSQIFFGRGVTSATASSTGVTLNGTGGLGTDIAGGALTLAAGVGTGAGTASILNLQVPTVGVSSATPQTMVTAMGFQSGKAITYNNIATVDGGIPSELGHLDLTGQTAAITATTIYTPTATGRFRISVYEKVTTAASVSSILGGSTGTVLTFTDGTDSVAQSITMGLDNQGGTLSITNSGNSTTTSLNGSAYIYAKTGVAIQIAVGYTSVNAAEMAFVLRATCEAL